MPSGPLPYEFHVTVEAAQTKPGRFIETCQDLGVKAIVLDLGVAHCMDMTDYMTSSKGKYETDDDAFSELTRIAVGLSGSTFKVIRRKIETAPWHQMAPQVEGDTMPEGCYFESHLAITCRPEEVPTLREGIQASASSLPLHLSRNQFKPADEDGNIVMMATMRNHSQDFATFSGLIEAAQMRINELGFEIAKPPITEFSMYDSNVHQDDAWLAISVPS